MTELLAPNGKPSNLTPEQYKLVRTPAFIEWFGDWQNDPENASKVVDENGEPLVCYHTTDSLFNVFENEIGIHFFSKIKEDSQHFFLSHRNNSDSNKLETYSVFLNIKKLFNSQKLNDEEKEKITQLIQESDTKFESYFDDFSVEKSDLEDYLNNELTDAEFVIAHLQTQYNYTFVESIFFQKFLLSENYDGFTIKEYDFKYMNYGVYDKKNIKLADGSNTTFDASNPDIRFKGGGEIKYLKGKKTQIWNILKNHYLSEQESEENEENYSRLNIFEDGDLAEFEKVKAFDKNLYFDFDMLENQIKEIAKNPSVTLIELEYGDYEKRVTDWLILYEKDKFNNGGEVIINPTEIECHKCHWHWKVKDGGDDLFICHKCFTDNSKYYKFEGLEGQKILDTISYAKGGRTLAQTPAPKKDQIKGSDKNKEGSSKDTTSAKKIKFSEETLKKIENKVDSHNEKQPNKKITIESAKAVVRRGMGAYSQTYRPTISGGKPNSRVAWGLARLNAFLYKIVNGKSKSGKYSQDNDLIEELGYKVEKFSDGGELENEEFENSALFFGGFFTSIQNQGIGKSIINDIFINNPKLENILLYTQQDAIGFWQKLGGQIIKQGEDKNGVQRYFVKINRNSLTKSKNIKELGVSYKNIENKKSEIDKGEYSILYGRQKIGFFFVNDLGTIKTDPKNIILNSSDKENYSSGGDIEAYEQAMGISQFDEGGESKPKKVYVSIPLKSDSRVILNEKGFWDGSRYREFEEKTFQDLQNQKLIGIIGVSSSPHNVGEWFVHRKCLIVMKYEEFEKINDFTIIDYNNPEQLMADDMKLFNRIYGGKRDEMIDDEKLKGQRSNSLYNILKRFNKFIEIAIRKEPNHLTKQGLYRIQYFIDESYKFREWINSNNYIINNPNDLAERIIEYHYSEDSNWISNFYGNTEDKNIDEQYIIPFVIEGVKFAGKIYKSEQEVYLNNKILNIPNDSQLFFKQEKDEKSNLLELIDKYKLREKYRIHFVSHKDIQKYSLIASKKRDEQELKNIELEKEKLEIDKDRVLHQIFNLFLTESINSFRNQINKEISEYSDSNLFYLDNESEEYKELDWYAIPLVQFIVNKYQEIVFNNWNKYVSSKNVKDVTIYAFSNFQTESYKDLKQFFEENKNELEKINDYRNINGGWLSEYRLEYWLKKSVDDYEDMPEWIDHKELAKLYLEKMDAKMYKYYTDTDIPLFSKYKDGGETDELIFKEKTKNNIMNTENPQDTITMNIPLLIRYSELMREDIKTDVALHEVIENLLDIKDKGVLTMDDYESVIGNITGTEENTNTDVVEEQIMAEGGKVNSIKSKKGDIKVSLDENWYSDDTKVELVPISELIKFREFDRKVKPKYNQDNSRDNINHLKYMFQKDGVKEPLIIEYSPQDNAVLVIEGNHRINSAMDLGMEYLPARVVLRKYSQFTPNQINNTMKVSGVTADNSGYISSDLKPSQVGIEGTMPIFADGGIIEGRLHSECDADEGCGRKFQVGENGHIIEAERDEAVIVADAFNDDAEYTIKGTPSEVASALNVMGGGKNFDKGAIIIKNGQELEIPELKKQAIDTDVDDIIDPSSIIINRRSMADKKQYEVTGTTKQIASAINSINGNGVVIERGAEIKEN